MTELLSHKSGLGGTSDAQQWYDDHTLKRENGTYSRADALAHTESELGEPRYSNVGYELLGVLLEKATGKQTYELLHEHVFLPAGLQAVYQDKDGKLKEIGHESGIRDFDVSRAEPCFLVDGDRLVDKENIPYWAAGGLMMQPDQQCMLMHYMCSSPHMVSMKYPQMTQGVDFYGLGMGGNEERYGHNGSVTGSRTEMWRVGDNRYMVSTATYVAEIAGEESYRARPDIAIALRERAGEDRSPASLRQVAEDMSRNETLKALNSAHAHKEAEEHRKSTVKNLEGLDLATTAPISPELIQQAREIGAQISLKPALESENKDTEEKTSWVDRSARTNRNNLTPGGSREI